MRYLIAGLMLVAGPVAAQRVQVEERTIEQLQADMTAGRASSADLVRAYLQRIERIDRRGPTLRSVIAVNPQALAQARLLDAERRAGRVRGPLHGVPVLVKDNIETAELPTTAGSLALKDNHTRRDAPLVARLRAAGAVILGKTNLSEWANIRSNSSMSGWSAVGGLVRNPYALDRTACGSSSGSGTAVAASLAAASVGTETDGSVVCPASNNGLVGFKPTVGMISRTHVVPISHSQDTPGPIAKTVRDAALMLDAMAGTDPADAATAEADARKRPYAAGLSTSALSGLRVAVSHPDNASAELMAQFHRALDVMRQAGAVLVDVKQPELDGLGEAELTVLLTELKADLDAYLATTPASVTTRTLDQVIAFNKTNAQAEMPYFGQELFEQAAKTKGLSDPGYKAARAKSLKLASDGIDAMLRQANATVLVTPTYGPAWLSDPVHGDQYSGPSSSGLPAVAGYPNLTVPMGLVDGLPVGISFIASRHGDAAALGAGYAYEQRARARVAPRYLPTVAAGAGLEGRLAK